MYITYPYSSIRLCTLRTPTLSIRLVSEFAHDNLIIFVDYHVSEYVHSLLVLGLKCVKLSVYILFNAANDDIITQHQIFSTKIVHVLVVTNVYFVYHRNFSANYNYKEYIQKSWYHTIHIITSNILINGLLWARLKGRVLLLKELHFNSIHHEMSGWIMWMYIWLLHLSWSMHTMLY
jgi:hypothetical protein